MDKIIAVMNSASKAMIEYHNANHARVVSCHSAKGEEIKRQTFIQQKMQGKRRVY